MPRPRSIFLSLWGKSLERKVLEMANSIIPDDDQALKDRAFGLLRRILQDMVDDDLIEPDFEGGFRLTAEGLAHLEDAKRNQDVGLGLQRH